MHSSYKAKIMVTFTFIQQFLQIKYTWIALKLDMISLCLKQIHDGVCIQTILFLVNTQCILTGIILILYLHFL